MGDDALPIPNVANVLPENETLKNIERNQSLVFEGVSPLDTQAADAGQVSV